MNWYYVNILLSFLIAASFACQSPSVTQTSYTTKDDVSSTKTLFVAQFTVKCKDGASAGNLFAEVGDRSLSVGKSSDGLSYQVSWTEEHKSAPRGTYNVRLYDETGYSNMRKAIRAGENVEAIKPLLNLDVVHKGVWKGAWVSSETVACLVSLVLLWYAYTTKNCILA